jgi:hypothetical protein
MERLKYLLVVAALLPMFALLHSSLLAVGLAAPSPGPDAVLKADEVGPKLFPDKVFFGGQVATVQLRNAGGVRFSDGAYTLAALVDSSGYSTDLRQKYQGYLLTQVALEVQGHKLPAGAYGFGFLAGNKFVILDLGTHDVFQAASASDAGLKRPVPLQVTGASAAGTYRLYAGREYIEWKRGQ